MAAPSARSWPVLVLGALFGALVWALLVASPGTRGLFWEAKKLDGAHTWPQQLASAAFSGALLSWLLRRPIAAATSLGPKLALALALCALAPSLFVAAYFVLYTVVDLLGGHGPQWRDVPGLFLAAFVIGLYLVVPLMPILYVPVLAGVWALQRLLAARERRRPAA